MYEKFYEKYAQELAFHNAPGMNPEEFEAMFRENLPHLHRVSSDGGEMYYFRSHENGENFCMVPVYGYWASSERALTELFCAMSEEVLKTGDTAFSIHLYAHDHTAQRLFAMLQFGYMAEKGIRRIPTACPAVQPRCEIRTLPRDEIEYRWDEIWALTGAIVNHLKQAPVFYPGEEFTEEVYREFYLDPGTRIHAAFSGEDTMIGMIETNEEPDAMIGNARSANIGEIFVLPAFRGTGLSAALLRHAESWEFSQGNEYLWVEHGTANPQARGFWNRYFGTYQYEMVRRINTF